MKIFILAAFVLASLHGNEMQRIENIVKDISKLRVDYAECSAKLKAQNSTTVPFVATKENSDDLIKNYEMSIEDEKQKNVILLKKLDESKLSVQKLEKLVKNQNNILKTKESELIVLQKESIKLVKIKEKYSISLENKSVAVVPQKVICETKEENSFPDLMMKESYTKKSIPKEMPQEIEPASYRLNTNASVFDAIAGSEISKWEKKRSFTSNIQSQNWIKITGYFIDKKWLPSEKEMWMKLEEVVKK